MSSIKLETNGRASSGKQTRHINIKYFSITDLVKGGEITLKHCPTNKMLVDYMTKSTIGKKFTYLRKQIVNIE